VSRRAPAWSKLLACGPLSSLLYVVAIDLVAARRHPGYHDYTSQMVSELMAVGAPTRPVLVRWLIPYNALLFAFASGVWASAPASRLVRLTAALLSTYAAISTAGLVAAPMALRGTPDSRRDPVHIAVTAVMSASIVATMAAGAFTRGRGFRIYSFATIGAVACFGALAGFLSRPMPGPTPGIGLAERVTIYATMLWFAVLGIAVWPRRRGIRRTNPSAD